MGSTWLWDGLQMPVLLVLIGLFSACSSYIISFSSNLSEGIKWNLSQSEGVVVWGVYAVWSVLLASLSLYITLTFCPDARGGGVIDMKAILSGHTQDSSLLTGRLILVKISGLMLAIASGLSVGKEGPLLQITAAFASVLLESFGDVFSRVRDNETKRLDVLACACASGISSTFGAAYGGVLYSIEVLCISSSSANIPRAYICSICAMMVFFWLGTSSHISLYITSKKDEDKELNHDEARAFKFDELLLCMMLGVVSGLAGALFVNLLSFVLSVRNYLLSTDLPVGTQRYRQYLIVCLVALMISPLMYLEEGFGIHRLYSGPQPLLYVLFRYHPIELSNRILLYLPLKFVVTIICVALPLPVGLFDPVFLLGGVIGRISGTFLSHIESIAHVISVREFSLIGAAAFSTGVTRAISTTVIVYELSGQRHMHLPLSVAVVTAYFVGNQFSSSAYDVILENSRFRKQLVPLIPENLRFVPIRHILNDIQYYGCLFLNSSRRDVVTLVNRFKEIETLSLATSYIPKEIAVLDNAQNMSIVGSAKTSDLQKYTELPAIKHPPSALDERVKFEKQDLCNGVLQYYSLDLLGTDHSDMTKLDPRRCQSPFQEEGKGWVWMYAGVSPSSMAITIDPSPHLVHDGLSLKKVEELMRNLKLDQVIITSNGKYVNSVSRSDLHRYMLNRDASRHIAAALCGAANRILGYIIAILSRESNRMYTPL